MAEIDPLTGLPKQPGGTQPTGLYTPTSTTPYPGFGSGAQVGATGPTTAGGIDYGPYRDIINADPFYRQTLADLAAQGVADESGYRTAAQQALIRFGEVPTDLDPATSGWIDQTTRQLAQQNTQTGLSQMARLAKMNKDAVRAMRSALAARGMLQSGELGHQLGEEQLRYGQAQYDQRLQLGDYMASLQQGMAKARRDAANAAAAAAQAAVGRGVAGGQGPAAPPPTTPPAAPPTTPPEAPASVNPNYNILFEHPTMRRGRIL